MGLLFKCKFCGADIKVLFLQPGDKAVCNNCGTYNVIPEDGIQIDRIEPNETTDDNNIEEDKQTDEPQNLKSDPDNHPVTPPTPVAEANKPEITQEYLDRIDRSNMLPVEGKSKLLIGMLFCDADSKRNFHLVILSPI